MEKKGNLLRFWSLVHLHKHVCPSFFHPHLRLHIGIRFAENLVYKHGGISNLESWTEKRHHVQSVASISKTNYDENGLKKLQCSSVQTLMGILSLNGDVYLYIAIKDH